MLDLLKNQEWALTERARLAVKSMKDDFGLDADLALSLLELSWPEDEIYNIEDGDSNA